MSRSRRGTKIIDPNRLRGAALRSFIERDRKDELQDLSFLAAIAPLRRGQHETADTERRR